MNAGRRLFQTSAAGPARNVKLGMITSPTGSLRPPDRTTPKRESGSRAFTEHSASPPWRLRQLPAERSSAL